MSVPQTRYHGLDALRGIAMLLGVVLHAGMVFTDPDVASAIAPEGGGDAGIPVTALSLWIHLWRMPLFFILAGFFAQMILERRGIAYFLQDRAVRILLTCLVFMALFNLMVSQPFGTLDHLWFLWVLWWISVILAGLHVWGVTAHIRLLTRAFATPRRMLWLLLPLAVMSLLLRDDTVVQRIPRLLTDLEPRGFLFCILFVFAGQALWLQRQVLATLARPELYWPCLIIGTLATPGILAIGEWMGEDPTLDTMILAGLMAAPLAGSATGMISIGFIGLTLHLVQGPSRFVTALVQLAYPVYVFHLWFALGFSGWLVAVAPDLPQLANVAVSSVLTTIASILSYLILVRFTPLEWLFAGRKHAWWQWPFKREKAAPDGAASNLSKAAEP